MKELRVQYMFEGKWYDISYIQKMLLCKYNNNMGDVINYLQHWLPIAKVRYLWEV